MKLYEIILLIILVIFFSVGISLHVVPSYSELTISLTPFVLLIFGLVAIFPALLESKIKLSAWIVPAYVTTFFLEVIGVKTGKIFGEYYYGETLGFTLFEVPVVIGFNWVIIILGAALFSKIITENRLLRSIITGGIAAGFDFIMEPIAIKLDYWQWVGDKIPLQNYAAWFLIAGVTAYFLVRFVPSIKTKIPYLYVAVQLYFFTMLRFLG